jgi:ankyrin repeat protein
MTFEDVFASVPSTAACEMLRQFVVCGGNVNTCDPESGWTLLHAACEHMNHDLIRLLAELGANLDVPATASGERPLHVAVDIDIDSVAQATNSFGHEFVNDLTFSTTRLLLSHGAALDVRDHRNRTPRDVVKDYAKSYDPSVLDRFDNLIGLR